MSSVSGGGADRTERELHAALRSSIATLAQQMAAKEEQIAMEETKSKKARLKATMLVMQREGAECSRCSYCAFVHASFMSVPRSEAVVGCFPAHNTRTPHRCV
jgi:7-cyano-7-deazaguanine synthase in queuosine biosynthesis